MSVPCVWRTFTTVAIIVDTRDRSGFTSSPGVRACPTRSIETVSPRGIEAGRPASDAPAPANDLRVASEVVMSLNLPTRVLIRAATKIPTTKSHTHQGGWLGPTRMVSMDAITADRPQAGR